MEHDNNDQIPLVGRRLRRAEIAEQATKGVQFHLCHGDLICAAVLQDFAAAAWAPEEAVSDAELYSAAERVVDRLQDVLGAAPTRNFLGDALDTLYAAGGLMQRENR